MRADITELFNELQRKIREQRPLPSTYFDCLKTNLDNVCSPSKPLSDKSGWRLRKARKNLLAVGVGLGEVAAIALACCAWKTLLGEWKDALESYSRMWNSVDRDFETKFWVYLEGAIAYFALGINELIDEFRVELKRGPLSEPRYRDIQTSGNVNSPEVGPFDNSAPHLRPQRSCSDQRASATPDCIRTSSAELGGHHYNIQTTGPYPSDYSAHSAQFRASEQTVGQPPSHQNWDRRSHPVVDEFAGGQHHHLQRTPPDLTCGPTRQLVSQSVDGNCAHENEQSYQRRDPRGFDCYEEPLAVNRSLAPRYHDQSYSSPRYQPNLQRDISGGSNTREIQHPFEDSRYTKGASPGHRVQQQVHPYDSSAQRSQGEAHCFGDQQTPTHLISGQQLDRGEHPATIDAHTTPWRRAFYNDHQAAQSLPPDSRHLQSKSMQFQPATSTFAQQMGSMKDNSSLQTSFRERQTHERPLKGQSIPSKRGHETRASDPSDLQHTSGYGNTTDSERRQRRRLNPVKQGSHRDTPIAAALNAMERNFQQGQPVDGPPNTYNPYRNTSDQVPYQNPDSHGSPGPDAAQQAVQEPPPDCMCDKCARSQQPDINTLSGGRTPPISKRVETAPQPPSTDDIPQVSDLPRPRKPSVVPNPGPSSVAVELNVGGQNPNQNVTPHFTQLPTRLDAANVYQTNHYDTAVAPSNDSRDYNIIASCSQGIPGYPNGRHTSPVQKADHIPSALPPDIAPPCPTERLSSQPAQARLESGRNSPNTPKELPPAMPSFNQVTRQSNVTEVDTTSVQHSSPKYPSNSSGQQSVNHPAHGTVQAIASERPHPPIHSFHETESLGKMNPRPRSPGRLPVQQPIPKEGSERGMVYYVEEEGYRRIADAIRDAAARVLCGVVTVNGRTEEVTFSAKIPGDTLHLFEGYLLDPREYAKNADGTIEVSSK